MLYVARQHISRPYNDTFGIRAHRRFSAQTSSSHYHAIRIVYRIACRPYNIATILKQLPLVNDGGNLYVLLTLCARSLIVTIPFISTYSVYIHISEWCCGGLYDNEFDLFQQTTPPPYLPRLEARSQGFPSRIF